MSSPSASRHVRAAGPRACRRSVGRERARGASGSHNPTDCTSSTARWSSGDLYGMQSFDQSLVRLYQAGLVARADALAHAGEPSEMKFELDRADFERGGAGRRIRSLLSLPWHLRQ